MPAFLREPVTKAKSRYWNILLHANERNTWATSVAYLQRRNFLQHCVIYLEPLIWPYTNCKLSVTFLLSADLYGRTRFSYWLEPRTSKIKSQCWRQTVILKYYFSDPHMMRISWISHHVDFIDHWACFKQADTETHSLFENHVRRVNRYYNFTLRNDFSKIAR